MLVVRGGTNLSVFLLQGSAAADMNMCESEWERVLEDQTMNWQERRNVSLLFVLQPVRMYIIGYDQ